VVEISPEVVEASEFFVDASGRPLDDRRARLHVLDARTWLRGSSARYDVVISEPSNPWQTGNASLFTLEHYEATRAALNPRGVFCQWLPYYRMEPADFKAAIRTLQKVFPETTIWFSSGDVLLVAATEPLAIDPRAFLARTSVEAVSRSLRGIEIEDGSALLAFLMLDPRVVREFAGQGPPFHTDNFPLLEFSAPKTLYRESAPEIIAELRRLAAKSVVPLAPSSPESLMPVYEGIARQRLLLKMPEAALTALDQAAVAGGASPRLAHLQSSAWNDIGVTLVKQGQPDRALAAFERGLRLVPDSPQIHLNLGLLAFLGGRDLVRAEYHLRAAVRLDPNRVDALLNLANLMSQQGRWADATAGWTRVLRIDPTNADARRGLEAAPREPAR
jgi:tetratricopeptide (TPR) repeat protein